MDDSFFALRRSQLYRFLADAYLYPTEDWTRDVPLLEPILNALDLPDQPLSLRPTGLAELQAEHRHALTLTGSLCYETEYGLPHEFRQSQEMADIAGFYRAFGFDIGGKIRERPDHLSAELEFMHTLTLKEALSQESGQVEQCKICVDAQRKFLRDHLARWTGWFNQRLIQSQVGGVYGALAGLTAAFIDTEADRLDAHPEPLRMAELKPTPFNPDFSCGDCAANEAAVANEMAKEHSL
jgi:nitrate reductase assembly molybdenum cofactor insertion protein NarJ